jgi:hypothetical protein
MEDRTHKSFATIVVVMVIVKIVMVKFINVRTVNHKER